MKKNDHSNIVISLSREREERNRSIYKSTRNSRKQSCTRVIAFTSGKGGVGKTSIVGNIGYNFAKSGKRVLILDADLGLGNLDVMLGIAPKFNLSHVILGNKSIDEILISGPGNMIILPASSGIQELTNLTNSQKINFFQQLDILIESVDVLLIDTAAGISTNVMDFNATAQEVVVIVSPEPTSITDAYALIKVLSLKYAGKTCKLIVNMVRSREEGREVFRQLKVVTERFLDINLDYLGYILHDGNVTKGVKLQKIVSEMNPNSTASRCFLNIYRKISSTIPKNIPKDNSNLFWHHLV